MATAHIEANKEDIAKIVLTSGDPKRCEHIAKTYLTDIKLVNTVRGMTAYTGYYKGKRLTIFPVGMGMPSMGIYAYELYKFYDVDIIIRMGSCGTLDREVDMLDTILLESSYTESNFAQLMNRDKDTHMAYASEDINYLIEQTAQERNINLKKGVGLCNDFFDVYLDEEKYQDTIKSVPQEYKYLGVEMEAFALFYIASMFNKKAACLLTVVDSRYKAVVITSEAREKNLNNMIEIALETSLKL